MAKKPLTPSLITEYRTKHGLSQRQFADLCGITQGQLSKIEGGTREPEPALKAFLEIELGCRTVPQVLKSIEDVNGPLAKLLRVIGNFFVKAGRR